MGVWLLRRRDGVEEASRRSFRNASTFLPKSLKSVHFLRIEGLRDPGCSASQIKFACAMVKLPCKGGWLLSCHSYKKWMPVALYLLTVLTVAHVRLQDCACTIRSSVFEFGERETPTVAGSALQFPRDVIKSKICVCVCVNSQDFPHVNSIALNAKESEK